MSETLTPEQEAAAAGWWNSLPEHQQIMLALDAAVGGSPTDAESELLYAAKKPWKWRDEAWLAHQNLTGVA